MPLRQFTSGSSYRYGFNGKEEDDEVKGNGNQQDYGMRIYDPRLGRFLSVDPIAYYYPWYSPYHFGGNSPIENIDVDGLEAFSYRNYKLNSPLTIIQKDLQIKENQVKAIPLKMAFRGQLPKKFIDHYVKNSGTTYKLSENELPQLHIYYTGLHGGVTNDIKKANDFLFTVKRGESRDLPDGYSIQGGAGNAGTLGRFTIYLKGTVTKEKDGKWSFKGFMKIYDVYDYKTGKTSEGDMTRNDWGDFQTNFANGYLSGKPFEIISDWIPVEQNHSDYFNWFTDKDQTDIPNRLNNLSGEIQKSGKKTGEVKKQKKLKN